MRSQGKLYIVGIGPGCRELMTLKAKKAIESSDYVIGHKRYVDFVRDLVKGKIIESGMGREVERVRLAVELAKNNVVSLVSGGDPCVYGIAPLVIEYIQSKGVSVDYEIIPGVSALNSASPLLGSPISGDHAVVSLSDLLVPWEIIERRLRKALEGDFVIAIYNPSSRKRKGNLEKAMKIVMEHRGDVFVGVVKNACREGEEVRIMKCSEVISSDFVDMSTIIFVPNSETVIKNGMMLTPRGYSRKYEV
ncbi:precorrin-3B C17-methyltransferase [Ferroglobus placidus DSM 10642]|uniref:Precorrin-3B C17-methyltransferase n=1 Tax=Ferroglobus placidus (strain DSM 10642 / AEDII12DO) TaxID=589924 RepID=D3S1D7_FERPA|nr:precorrin-3B C(17)-methyltransferase [Ferroglobus placidus]ADC66401.1 precorrin-3B C17-methyltransferase [Ferroglobus placidus DSM 10642]